MNKRSLEKYLNFHIEKYPNTPRNAFILSILICFISIFLPMFIIPKSTFLKIILIVMPIIWGGSACIGCIVSLIQEKPLYKYLNIFMMVGSLIFSFLSVFIKI